MNSAETKPLVPPDNARSQEVQEILDYIPNTIVRAGTVVILLMLIAMLLATWFIKYPDTIQAKIVLTDESPPVSIVAKSPGRIDFLVHENDTVRAGEFLGVIENSSDTRHILCLINQVDSIRNSYATLAGNQLVAVPLCGRTLGIVQPSYLALQKAVDEYNSFIRLSANGKQILDLSRLIEHYISLNAHLETQLKLFAQKLDVSRSRYSSDSLLLKQNAISNYEYNISKYNYLNEKKDFENASLGIINNRIQISQLGNKINELKINEAVRSELLGRTITESFIQLENALENWKLQYLLVSPMDGNVSYFKYWSDNQVVAAGDEVMIVVAGTNQLFGNVKMPIAGAGKVQLDQKVKIKFDNYPYHEYGMVYGNVDRISLVPRNSEYYIRIKLVNGLRSSYNRDLVFQHEMAGTAEIITDDLRLFERIFNQFRELFEKLNGGA